MSKVTPAVEAAAREMLARMTPREKVRLLAGDHDFYRDVIGGDLSGSGRPLWSAAGVPRLGLGGLRMVDGPRGVARGVATCFPVAMARAASFDPALEERVGEAIGREARALGANVCLAPCINLLRHPGWGRAQETYGEDPQHVGDMGAAFVRGAQRHVMACAKHFACNSIENSRFRVDVTVRPDVLDRVYLPHFKRVVDEGVASVMSAYNSLNGEWCGENRTLLTTILKERWGFDGFVVSDWVFGVRDGVEAIGAGLDLEMPSPLFVDDRVAKALARGILPQARVDDAALRLIRQQLRFAPIGDLDYDPGVVACDEHRALAREAAVKGIVLLRNERVGDGEAEERQWSHRPLLPLQVGELRRLAVIGRLADQPNTGDNGSSDVTSPYVVTPLAGLREALRSAGVEVVYDDGSRPERAADVAASADAVILVAGFDHRDEGEYMGEFGPSEAMKLLPRPPFRSLPRVLMAAARRRHRSSGSLAGGDRRSLTLHAEEEGLIRAVAAANRRTIVVLVCGSAVLMERWRHSVPAILILWYAGMEGGNALADVVLGRKKPTGRLPFTIPTSADHLPAFDPDASAVTYDELFGQRLLNMLGVAAAYPFGFGLAYE
jgi:beta-glucosidase